MKEEDVSEAFVCKQEQKADLFLLTAGACLLTVGLLCLQSIEVLLRRTFAL